MVSILSVALFTAVLHIGSVVSILDKIIEWFLS